MTTPTAISAAQLSDEDLKTITARGRAMWEEAEKLAKSGHFKRAVQKSLNGAALFDATGDVVRRARMLGQAGAIAQKAHHYRASAYYLWKAFRGLPKGEIAERAWILGLLARVYRHLWDFNRAEKYNRLQLKISMEQNNALQTAYAHLGLGLNYYYQRQWDSSLEHNLKAVEISNSLDDGIIGYTAKLLVACIYNAKRRFGEALPILQSLVSPESTLHDAGSICMAYEELARLYLATDEMEKFKEARDETAKWASLSRNLANVGRAVLLDAECFWREGQRRKAIRYARRAIGVFRSNGDVEALHMAEDKLFEWLKGENHLSERVKKTRGGSHSGSRSVESSDQAGLSR